MADSDWKSMSTEDDDDGAVLVVVDMQREEAGVVEGMLVVGGRWNAETDAMA